MSLANRLLDVTLDVLSPSRCAACSERVIVGNAFCVPCASTLVEMRETSSAVAAFVYGGALADAIVQFKYRGRHDLGRPLGLLAARALPRLVSDIECIVPVPLHALRIVERGFDQATLLAREVSRVSQAPLALGILARVRPTPRQAELDRAARVHNVRGAFRADDRVAGRRVLLVDDVRTTGATLDACARALLDAGAREVSTLTLALADEKADTSADGLAGANP